MIGQATQEFRTRETERPFGSYDSTIQFDKEGKPIINKHLGNRLYTGKDEELMRSRHGDPPREDFNDGERYRGRGFVQLTGRYNYQQMQKRLESRMKLDLVEHPEAAEDADTAAGILACVMALHRAEIETAMSRREFTRARKVVNSAGLGMAEFMAVVNAFNQAPVPAARSGTSTTTPAPRTREMNVCRADRSAAVRLTAYGDVAIPAEIRFSLWKGSKLSP